MTDPLDGRFAELARHAERASTPLPVSAIRRRARRRTVTTVTTGATITALLVAAGVGLALRPDRPEPPPSTFPTSAAPSRSPSPSPSPPALVSPSPTPTECRTAGGLRTSAGVTDSGAGHRSLRIVFINAGTAPCRMRGYPGVAAVNASGTQVAQAQRTLVGYMGGANSITAVTIPVGRSASAVVEADVFGPGGGACPPYAGLLVTAPDDTASTPVAWTTDSCANLQVHPVASTG